MKKLIVFSVVLSVAASTRALPTYDNFSSYGAAGAWQEVNDPPIISYTTGSPLLGGNTAPGGESWIMYTNAPGPADLFSAYYSFTGSQNQNVGVVNYFSSGQPGNSDTVGFSAPGTNFPGPFVVNNDTSAYSVWTPGWGQTTETSPPIQAYLGGIGACLQFSSPVSGAAGSKVFASFFVDVPDCTASYGSGQSLDHGYSAGFLPASELPTAAGVNQYCLPGVPSTGAFGGGFPASGDTTYALAFAKFNARDVTTSQWRTGVGFLDSNANSDNTGTGECTQKTIHFVVISYEFNGGYSGGTADAIRIWTDPASTKFGSSTEPTSDASSSPTNNSTYSLQNAGGFFFLANTQNGGATPNSGIMFNSLHIGTNWAYVTGGLQSTAAQSVTATVGQTVVLNAPLAAGGVPITSAAWANSSGPCTGPRYSVNATTGALTITGVEATDGDIYSVSASTPVTTYNSFAATPAQNTVPLTVLTSESANAASTQFTLNFTGPVGVGYRIWYTTSLNSNPVLTAWTQISSGNFTSGANTFTDNAASAAAQFYTITVP